MKFYVYEDGCHGEGDDYEDMTPKAAALLFAEERDSDAQACRVIVEAKDEAAVALGGWRKEDGDLFRIYKVVPTVTWDATEQTD